jgi:hypothetical protein
MEKPTKSLNVEKSKNSLLPSESLMKWKPSEDLQKAIAKSWGMETVNERSSSTRPT